MRLALVRHGESTWNLEHRVQGQTPHVPLTDAGRAQALSAGELLREHGFAGAPVVASDLLRTVETAAIVARGLGGTVATTPLLREQALGELEGRLTSELVAEPTPEGVHVSEVRWGGGESLAQVHERCRELLRHLHDTLPADADRAVLVGHGDALRVLLAVLDGRGHRHVEWAGLGNGEVVEREWRRPGGGRGQG